MRVGRGLSRGGRAMAAVAVLVLAGAFVACQAGEQTFDGAGSTAAGTATTDGGTPATPGTSGTSADGASAEGNSPDGPGPDGTSSIAPTSTPAAAGTRPGTTGRTAGPAPTSRRSSTPRPQPPPEPGPACGTAGGHPTPRCVGVPAGTRLTVLPNNEGNAYRVTTPGQVIDGRHIQGNLLITAHDVTVRNSVIDGTVTNEYAGAFHRFTISDSTVGPASGCITVPGVGEADYTASRLLVRGHGDGFRIGGSNVVVQNSYVRLCSNPGDHSDGVQDYPGGTNVVIRNNTIDQRNVAYRNAPIFVNNTSNLTVSGNLLMGGTYTLRVLANRGGPVWIQDNKLVDGAWDYGPTETRCDVMTWSGNQLVTIDAGYNVTSVVRPLGCAN